MKKFVLGYFVFCVFVAFDAVKPLLVPDYDRDGEIMDGDYARARAGFLSVGGGMGGGE